jgi:hypothetical protein
MSFVGVLNQLLEETAGAVGVLFLDESGEVVDMVSRDLPDDEIRILGAYLGIYMRQLAATAASARLGRLRSVHLEKASLQMLALSLPDGYALVLVQRRPAPVARAKLSLLAAGEELRRQAFS